MSERRNVERREFSYYMRLVDNDTQELIGHLMDISSGGFKLDSQKPIPVNKDFRLRMDLTNEVANKPYMVFVARSKWCDTDPLDPFVYNVGFQLINVSPSDFNIIKRMIEKYGKKIEDKRIDKRRSNLW